MVKRAASVALAAITPLPTIMADLRDRLVARLEAEHISVPDEARQSEGAAFRAVLRISNRSIPPRPRLVHLSDVLHARFDRLHPSTRVGLNRVVKELKCGEDVNQRLTRQHYKAGFNDRFYNHLGIVHLHLGRRNSGRDKTKRHVMSGGGKLLLWGIVDTENAYLIDVWSHAAFKSYDFVRIVGVNWKHLLEPSLPGIPVRNNNTLPPRDVAAARKAGLHAIVPFQGVGYVPGGLMCDGTNSDVTSHSDRILNDLVRTYRWLESNVDKVCEELGKRLGLRPTFLSLKVGDLEAFVHGRVSLVEESTGGEFVLASDGISFKVDRQNCRCSSAPF